MGNNRNLKNERKYIRRVVEQHFDEWLDAARGMPLKERLRIAASLIFPWVKGPKITAK